MITPINTPINQTITNAPQNAHAKKITSNDRVISMLNELNSPEKQKSARVGAIQERIRQGKNLSSDELNYLRENNPEAYEKAMKISAARQLLETRLKSCTTKEEVRALQMSSVGEITSGKSLSTSAQQNDFTLMQIRAANNVFEKFTQSDQFKQLPNQKRNLIDKQISPFAVPQKEDSVGAKVVAKLKAQRIAMRIARGETVTNDEQSFISKTEPGLVSDAKRAVDRRKKIELEMRYKTNNKEKKQFLQRERNNIIGFERNGSSAELMLGAIDKLGSEL